MRVPLPVAPIVAGDGVGAMPPWQRRQLTNLVHDVHWTGLQRMLLAVPDTPGRWTEAKAAGVDFIGGDAPPGGAATVGGR